MSSGIKRKFKVIAPSSAFYFDEKAFEANVERLKALGIEVEYGRNLGKGGLMRSASIKDRVEELVEAFQDPKIDGIMTIIGGLNSEEILDFIPYDIIAKNRKFFCGYSDITVLQNAFWTKCGLVSFSGPHFSSFGMKKGFEYTQSNFEKALNNKEYTLESSEKWANDAWWIDQENRTFYDNEGWKVINKGDFEGRIVGGNMSSLAMLFGTEYMPSLKDTVLFIEEAEIGEDGNDSTFPFFLRNLGTLIKQKGFDGVKGIVIGRFHKKAGVTDEHLRYIVESHPKLKNIPIIANVDFGHTTPFFTFPIGGRCQYVDDGGKVRFKVFY